MTETERMARELIEWLATHPEGYKLDSGYPNDDPEAEAFREALVRARAFVAATKPQPPVGGPRH